MAWALKDSFKVYFLNRNQNYNNKMSKPAWKDQTSWQKRYIKTGRIHFIWLKSQMYENVFSYTEKF